MNAPSLAPQGHNNPPSELDDDARTAYIQLYGNPKVQFPHKAILADLGLTGRDWYDVCDLYATDPKGRCDTSALVRLISRCISEDLDWRGRPFYVDPRNVKDGEGWTTVLAINPTIAYWRIKAHKSGTYHGSSIKLGPKGQSGVPEWAQCTVCKVVGGMRTVFEGPVCYFSEVASTFQGRDGVKKLMGTWATQPSTMLQKRAEAAALRQAYTHGEASFETMDRVARLTQNALGMNPLEDGEAFQAPAPFDEMDAEPLDMEQEQGFEPEPGPQGSGEPSPGVAPEGQVQAASPPANPPAPVQPLTDVLVPDNF